MIDFVAIGIFLFELVKVVILVAIAYVLLAVAGYVLGWFSSLAALNVLNRKKVNVHVVEVNDVEKRK